MRRRLGSGAFRKVFALLLLCLAGAWRAAAHDTWLAPNNAAVPVGSTVLLDLTSGMAFPALEFAVKPERVVKARVRLGGATSVLGKRKAGPQSLRVTARLAQAGVATLWIELAPKALELTPDKVAEYLDEIGASPEIRRAWEEGGAGRRWREVYTKHAKTYVRVGEPATERSWAEPCGMNLEILPEADPTALHAGDALPVRVLREGKPFAGFPVGLVHAGEAHGLLQTTDAEGRTTFRLERSGRWLLRGTDLRRSKKPATEWESDFATLVLEVR